MSCRVCIQRAEAGAVSLTQEQLATLLELALQRNEAIFKELARSLGVGARAVNQLWARTVARPAPARRRGRPAFPTLD